MEPGAASLFESVLAIALFEAGQLEVVGKEGAAGHFTSGWRPQLGNIEGKTDCERSLIEARQEPVLRRPKPMSMPGWRRAAVVADEAV